MFFEEIYFLKILGNSSGYYKYFCDKLEIKISFCSETAFHKSGHDGVFIGLWKIYAQKRAVF